MFSTVVKDVIFSNVNGTFIPLVGKGWLVKMKPNFGK